MRPLQHLAPDSTSVGANGLTGDVVGWTALIYHVTFTKVQNCSIHGLAVRELMLSVCSADAWYMLGQAHMGLGHYRAAISAFRRANQIDPANVHIRSAVLQAEQILEEVQQGKYAQATFSPGALNAGRNTA